MRFGGAGTGEGDHVADALMIPLRAGVGDVLVNHLAQVALAERAHGPVEVAEGGRTQFFAPDRNSFKKVSGE